MTSYHEVGHALIDKLLPDANELHKVSIIPRGMALGVTWTRPKDESVHVSKAKLLAKITVSLGGRAAEEIIYGQDDVSTGASQDLINVTDIARKMVTAWGMSEKLGPMAYGKTKKMYLWAEISDTKEIIQNKLHLKLMKKSKNS